MAARVIEFFYGLGSRYSYLASTQLDELATTTGCEIRWRPLFSADLFAARGRDPFQGEPASPQYDWAYRRRDAERWAALYGVPYREPGDVDYEPRRLALACTAAAALGAVAPFSRRLFRALFVEGLSPLDDAACIRLAGELGLDQDGFLRVLADPETAVTLRATVTEAVARGLFGVPSFVCGDEVYFGNDRLPLVRHALLTGVSQPGG
jgi:2-hydroxychromene-2-carboxylate isomerase